MGWGDRVEQTITFINVLSKSPESLRPAVKSRPIQRTKPVTSGGTVTADTTPGSNVFNRVSTTTGLAVQEIALQMPAWVIPSSERPLTNGRANWIHFRQTPVRQMAIRGGGAKREQGARLLHDAAHQHAPLL